MVEPSENNPIFKLEPFLPFYDENDPFICSLEKYKSDLIYHYENCFYNLASFSFHYLYMTIISSYLLKYHQFNIETINALRRQSKKLKEVTQPNLAAYSGVRKESQILDLFEKDLEVSLKEQHAEILRQRNEIAHSCGRVIDLYELEQQVKYSIGVLEGLIEVSLSSLVSSESFIKNIEDINTTGDPGDRIDKTVSLIQDFYITEIDAEYLTSLGVVDLSNYQSIKDSII
ncbi:MAG: hypothetical protein JW974_02370 [Alphaproteobacteria bacterium]|nr:hypothetical protein [Alphaproteobacteria bacterium]MBN2675263.1 hypothetical protein [Alphaproteobacteria bacterium]